MNQALTIMIYVALSIFVLPTVVYLCVKFGTFAFYKAKQSFKKEQ